MAIITEIQQEEEAATTTTTYAVFLSFRGIDTRLGFTDYLYHALVDDNISTFRDEEEVETGEELKPELARAIKSSRASVIGECNKHNNVPISISKLKKVRIPSLDGCLGARDFLMRMKDMESYASSSSLRISKSFLISLPPSLVSLSLKGNNLSNADEGYVVFDFLATFTSLGWTDLQHVKDLKVPIQDIWRLYITKKLPVQMFYEFGIFSTCFPGKVVPDRFAQKSNGSSISFTMPSSSMNKTIQGINICFVYTCSDPNTYSSYLSIEVRNVTKERTWKYFCWKFAVGEADKDLVWLSHWMFGNNEIENDDEVSVRIGEDGLVMVRECAVSPVYNDRGNEEDPLSYYKSWKRIIGGDLSAFQRSPGTFELYSPI